MKRDEEGARILTANHLDEGALAGVDYTRCWGITMVREVITFLPKFPLSKLGKPAKILYVSQNFGLLNKLGEQQSLFCGQKVL